MEKEKEKVKEKVKEKKEEALTTPKSEAYM